MILYNFNSNQRFTSLRSNLLSSSLETKIILVSESKRMHKSCCTNHMWPLRMHKLFCDSSHIVKNETMFFISFSDSTLFITSDSQSHNIRCFNTLDLFMKSSEFVRLHKEVFHHYSTVTLKTVKLSLFLTCTCDCSFTDHKL